MELQILHNVTTYRNDLHVESIIYRQGSVLCCYQGIMSELTEFKRGWIVGTRMVGASASKVAEVFAVSRGTVCIINTAHGKRGKTAHDKHQGVSIFLSIPPPPLYSTMQTALECKQYYIHLHLIMTTNHHLSTRIE